MKERGKGKTQSSVRGDKVRLALEECQFRLGLLVNYLPQKIFVKDKDLTYLFCNDSYARDLNIKAENIAGMTDLDFYPKDLAEKYRADDKRLIDTAGSELLQERYTLEGQEFVVETFKKAITDKDGKTICLLGVFNDITEIKQVEMEAIKKNKVLNAINTIFRENIKCDTEEDLARTCLVAAQEVTGSQFGFIGELNSAGRFDTIALSNPGWDACQVARGEATLLIKDMEVRGLWGRVIQDERSLIVNKPKTHPDRVGLPEGHPPLTSFLGVPLKHGGRTIGMIALANKPDGYEIADQEAVEALVTPIVEAMRSKLADQTLARQAQEILELSTPVVQVWEGVVVAPLIGVLDSQRTYRFMERFLERIVDTESPVALVDITGVPTVDTETAQHLIEAITAARLLGTQVVLTGVSPAIAQTLVHLGVDLSDIETRSSLVGGLRVALNILGLEIIRKAESPREERR